MDRRRLHPGHLRVAVVRGQPERPLRQTRLAQHGPSGLRGHVSRCRADGFGRSADRRAGGHGHRRGRHLPDHPRPDLQHLHRARSTRQGHRGVGGDDRRRCGRRPDLGGLAARELLLGIDLLGQRSPRRDRHRRGLAVRADVTRPGHTADRRAGPPAVGRGRHGIDLHDHRSAQRRMGQRSDDRGLRPRSSGARRFRHVGTHPLPSDARPVRLPQSAVLGRQPAWR